MGRWSHATSCVTTHMAYELLQPWLPCLTPGLFALGVRQACIRVPTCTQHVLPMINVQRPQIKCSWRPQQIWVTIEGEYKKKTHCEICIILNMLIFHWGQIGCKGAVCACEELLFGTIMHCNIRKPDNTNEEVNSVAWVHIFDFA